MKTQEEIVRKHAVGAINIYEIYKEGYNDRKSDEEDRFRREAAKDILVGLCANNNIGYYGNSNTALASSAITLADELIKQLHEEEK